jgi:hypothetical protein
MKAYVVFAGPCDKDWKEQPLEGSDRAIFMKFLQYADQQLEVAR